MKHAIIGLVFALGCAGTEGYEPEVTDAGEAGAPEELGQVAQALTIPAFYGQSEFGLGSKCATTSSSYRCLFPASKTRRFRFHAGTCSTWWQTRVVEAEAYWKPVLIGAGWTYSGPGSGGAADIHIKCGPCPSGGESYGCNQTTSMTCSGNVCKVNTSTVWLDTATIEANTSDVNWPAQSEARRKRFARAIAIHEVGHAVGLGHDVTNASPQDPAVVPADLYGSAMTNNAANSLAFDQAWMPWAFWDLSDYQP